MNVVDNIEYVECGCSSHRASGDKCQVHLLRDKVACDLDVMGCAWCKFADSVVELTGRWFVEVETGETLGIRRMPWFVR